MSPVGTSTITPSSRGTPDVSAAPPDPKSKERRMSLSEEILGVAESATPNLSRRTVLRRIGAAGLLALPAVGLLEACATSSTPTGGSSGGTVSDTNPLGVSDSAPLEVVIFNGGF